MLENPARQIVLVLLFIAASVASLLYKGVNLGNDLAGGTELIYEVDKEQAIREGRVQEGQWEEFMSSIVNTIQSRIDPDGTLNAEVVKRGETGIYVGLPKVTVQEAKEVEAKITRLGILQMQICAYENYESEKVEDSDKKRIFADLGKERDRLKVWLTKNDNKARLQKDPLQISDYHALSPDDGGPLLTPAQLRWVPRKIEGRIAQPEVWQYSITYSSSTLSQFCVPLFEQEEHNKPAEPGKYLVEYIPVNFDETGFEGKDLIAEKVTPSTHPDTGGPVVLYEIKPEKASIYGDISEKNIGNQSAIILDGFIKSAPVYQSRIPGRGMIEGFTQPEAVALSDVLKRGSLEVKPELQSNRTVGPTLGHESIIRGVYSLVIGSVIVLAFILYYYRLAGVVATVGLLLNVGFVFGAVSFIGATLTLPGLGGLVLTVGMAVDANILIYERIREEQKSGKHLQQAVRHGFERAMVTILDANITTFIAGLVLYNFGVGPIRGFAVTVMVGIFTSLFTAFFVSRLIFHYLLERKLERLPMAEWFTGLRFNFLQYGRIALVASSIVIVGGLVVFFNTDSQTKNSMDFTGGAVIHIATKEPHTPQEIRDLLLGDGQTEFVRVLGKVEPVVNSFSALASGENLGGKSRMFSVKVKVNDDLADRIEKAKEAAKTQNEVYRPPYVDAIAATLKDVLVPQAFTEPGLTPKGDGRSKYADLVVHYSKPVPVAEVRKKLTDALGRDADDVAVTALVDGKADASVNEAANLRLEFDVGSDVDERQLLTFTHEKLKASGFDLSNPIPDVATLGGRMVGELQSAAFGAMIVALFCIVMYIRVRFREYKYGLGAVAALAHDVLVALGLVVLFNSMGWVSCELSLSMIAAFLTIVGYSINDTIVIFDRIRENLANQVRAGDTHTSFADTVNLSINQTLGRTILTSFTTLFVVIALFAVNYGAGSELEGFAFAMIIGVFTGTYSTIFIASPIVMWLRAREKPDAGLSEDAGLAELGPADGSAEEEGQMPAISNT